MLPSGQATRPDVMTGPGIRLGTTAVMAGTAVGMIPGLGTIPAGDGMTTAIMVGILPGTLRCITDCMALGMVLGDGDIVPGTTMTIILTMLSEVAVTIVVVRLSVPVLSVVTDRPTVVIAEVPRHKIAAA